MVLDYRYTEIKEFDPYINYGLNFYNNSLIGDYNHIDEVNGNPQKKQNISVDTFTSSIIFSAKPKYLEERVGNTRRIICWFRNNQVTNTANNKTLNLQLLPSLSTSPLTIDRYHQILTVWNGVSMTNTGFSGASVTSVPIQRGISYDSINSQSALVFEIPDYADPYTGVFQISYYGFSYVSVTEQTFSKGFIWRSAYVNGSLDLGFISLVGNIKGNLEYYEF